MADVVIRVASGDDDVAAAGALTAEAYHADGLIDDGDEYAGELLDAARRAREATLLVALVPTGAGGQVVAGGPGGGSKNVGMALVGTITLAPAGSSYAEIAEPGEAEVRMLAVAPEVRRRGIAEALTRAAMLEAVSLGSRRVVLSTLDAMTTAHRLYDRLGFVALPERDWHHEGVALCVYAWDVPRGPGVRVETAVWTPREVRDVDGWRVGLSGGFTRRANSVVAVAEPGDVPASIDEVERVYAAAGLPPIFRVCAQSMPDNLDDLLRLRGYRDVSHTVVMVRQSLDGSSAAARDDARGSAGGLSAGVGQGGAEIFPGADGTSRAGRGISCAVADEPDAAWLSVWLADKAARSVDPALAAGVLSGVPAVYLTAWDRGTPVGVIRAALEQDWVGLSCLVVQPGARRRGIGRALTDWALRSCADRGARRAFLQVAEANEPAIALYWQAGFTPAERYHYRER